MKYASSAIIVTDKKFNSLRWTYFLRSEYMTHDNILWIKYFSFYVFWNPRVFFRYLEDAFELQPIF